MAWAYCANCEGSLGMATLAEAFAGKQTCPCGTDRVVNDYEKVAIADSLEERIKALEEKLQ